MSTRHAKTLGIIFFNALKRRLRGLQTFGVNPNPVKYPGPKREHLDGRDKQEALHPHLAFGVISIYDFHH
jgi:hypothetical protein